MRRSDANRRGLRGFGERRAVAPAWTPASLGASLLLWLRADADTITVAGSGVSLWADQSGHGLDVSQGTDSLRPSYEAASAAFGAQPTIVLSAAGHRLVRASLASWAQPVTGFHVSSGETSSTARRATGFASSGDVLSMYKRTGPVLAMQSNSVMSGGTVTGSAQKVCCVFNGASSALYVDGAFSTAAATGDCGAATGSDFAVGAAPNGTLPWDGEIAEVLYVDGVLDATTRAQLAAYADARYAL